MKKLLSPGAVVLQLSDIVRRFPLAVAVVAAIATLTLADRKIDYGQLKNFSQSDAILCGNGSDTDPLIVTVAAGTEIWQ